MTPRPQALKNSKTRNPPSESESKSWGLVTYRCDFVLDVNDGHCQIYSSGTSRLPLHQYTVFLWFCEVLNRKESIPCVWLVLWGEIHLDDLDGHLCQLLGEPSLKVTTCNNGDNMGQRVNDAKASSRSTVTFGCSFSGAGGTWNKIMAIDTARTRDNHRFKKVPYSSLPAGVLGSIGILVGKAVGQLRIRSPGAHGHKNASMWRFNVSIRIYDLVQQGTVPLRNFLRPVHLQ